MPPRRGPTNRFVTRETGLLLGCLALAACIVVGCTAIATTQTASAVSLSETDIRNGRAAFASADRGNWKNARSLVGRVSDPLARTVLQWINITRTGSRVPFADVTTFIDNNPDWPSRRLLRRRAEEAMGSDLAAADILEWFNEHEPVSTSGRIRWAQALLAAGGPGEGRAAIRDTWVNGDFTRAEEKRFYRAHRKLLTHGDHVRRLDRLQWEGRHGPARRMLWKVNADYRALGEARLLLRRREGNVDRAVAKVPEALKSDPGLVYERLRWRRRKGLETSAREWLEAHPLDLSRPELWWRERAALARQALDDGHVSEAYRIVTGHAVDDGIAFAEASWLAGWISLRYLREPKTGLDHFSAMYNKVNFPISRARAAYWAGRAAEALTRPEVADHWYRTAANHPTTYYGQLAAARVNGPTNLHLPQIPEPTEDEARAFENNDRTRVARMLHAFGQKKRLDAFVLRLTELGETPAWKAMSAALARSLGRPDLAVTVAKRSARGGHTFVREGYPVVPLPTVEARLPRPVEDPLLLAMIRQESAFQVDAKSSAGARGLMQVMPATARRIVKRLKLPFSSRRLNGDRDYNIRVGRGYLAGLLDAFDGSYVLALTAYNAGPARVRAWIRANGDPREGDVDVIDWIEQIPFAETRNYVQRTLESLQVYRGRLAETEIATTIETDLTR